MRARARDAGAQEDFPAWHRGYLVEFETALQAADRANGGDGRIALPYWDWLRYERLPPIIRSTFQAEPMRWVQQLVPDPAVSGDTAAAPFWRQGFRPLASDFEIGATFRADDLQGQVDAMLRQPVHFRAASTGGRDDSVESPHNDIHNALSFPMMHPLFASFYPAFWLHHCQVDRLYEAYLVQWGHEDTRAEFERSQRGQRDNKYTAPLAPFAHPRTGRALSVADTFDIVGLGYDYERPLPRAPQNLAAAPTRAVFAAIDINAIDYHSYQIFVLVNHDGPPPSDKTGLLAAPSLAGIGNVFGGKGPGCVNCLTNRTPFDVKVDIGAKLRARGLSRYEARLTVVTMDEDATVAPLASTRLPAPTIEGTWFEDRESTLSASTPPSAVTAGETAALQTLLAKWRYYAGPVDGVYTAPVAAAVCAFQAFAALPASGECDARTKEALLRRRYDRLLDAVSADGSALVEASVAGDRKVFASGATLSYSVGETPGYMPRAKALNEIATAIDEWAASVPLSFVLVPADTEAEMTIAWSDLSVGTNGPGGGKAPAASEFYFDGPGGKLAHTEGGAIVLDSAERWLLQGEEPPLGVGMQCYALLPVVLHEIGHVLGLVHAAGPGSVMSPWYASVRTALTPLDLARVRALYGADKEPAPAGAAATDYVAAEINPTLSRGLVALCAARPPNPVQWLGEWLRANRPHHAL